MQMMMQQRQKLQSATNHPITVEPSNGVAGHNKTVATSNKSIKMPAVKRKFKEALSSESATDDQRQDEKATSSHS